MKIIVLSFFDNKCQFYIIVFLQIILQIRETKRHLFRYKNVIYYFVVIRALFFHLKYHFFSSSYFIEISRKNELEIWRKGISMCECLLFLLYHY